MLHTLFHPHAALTRTDVQNATRSRKSREMDRKVRSRFPVSRVNDTRIPRHTHSEVTASPFSFHGRVIEKFATDKWRTRDATSHFGHTISALHSANNMSVSTITLSGSSILNPEARQITAGMKLRRRWFYRVVSEPSAKGDGLAVFLKQQPTSNVEVPVSSMKLHNDRQLMYKKYTTSEVSCWF